MLTPGIKPRNIIVTLISIQKNLDIQGTKIKVKERMKIGSKFGIIPEYKTRISVYWKPNKAVFDKKLAKRAIKYLDWGNNSTCHTNMWIRLKEDFSNYNEELETIKFERVLSPKGQDKDEQIICKVLNEFENEFYSPF